MSERTSHVVTIGVFDGVHLGHQALLERTRDIAMASGHPSAVVTFDRHPLSVLRPEHAPKVLTSLDHKLTLLHRCGIDTAIVMHFDEARATQPAEDFVAQVLMERLRVSAVVVGEGFCFGRDREGTTDYLSERGAKSGFDVVVVPPVVVGDEPVSSTRIRRAISRGDVAHAAEWLTRPHEVHGLVVMGDGRGRQLGFPTANVHVSPDICLPLDGVYAGVFIDENAREHLGAISIGTRPTFYADGMNLVEAHVIDFDGDLYGQRVSLRFASRLRSQERFKSIDELVAAMNDDVRRTRQHFEASHSSSPGQ